MDSETLRTSLDERTKELELSAKLGQALLERVQEKENEMETLRLELSEAK